MLFSKSVIEARHAKLHEYNYKTKAISPAIYRGGLAKWSMVVNACHPQGCGSEVLGCLPLPFL